MCVALLPEELDEFYSYLVFKSLPIIRQSPMNMNNLALKVGPFRWATGNKMTIFSKGTQMILNKFR
jgi:hypothetical protein